MRRHEPTYLLDGNSKDGDHSWTYLFNDYSDRGYPRAHGKMVSSVAIVCVATIARSQWKSLVTRTNLSNGHIDEQVGESATSV